MKVNINSLSTVSQIHVREAQEYVLAETGKHVTPAAVIDGFVRGHLALTSLLEVDASLFAMAIESLCERDQEDVIAMCVRAIGDASGFWRSRAPTPEVVRISSFAPALRSKADELAAAQERRFLDA